MKQFEFDPEHTFFTSDTHWNHANIINLCRRPFRDVNHMNDMLVENWNSVVTDDDTVFHLGDFALGGSDVWNKVLSRLNGKIYLILGNHDHKNIRQGYMDKFEAVVPQMQIRIENRSIYLNHYPFLCYGGTYRKPEDTVWQLFGHVHSGPNGTGIDIDRLKYLFPTQYDVGVDNNNYIPVSYIQVKHIIEKQVNESN